jgi:hypothetical protein
MQIKPVEVYAEDSNYAVIKPPGRSFPGCVIQGDSLRILCGLATSVARRIRDHQPEDEEFLGDVEELVGQLVGRLLHYQDVLRQHGVELPYSVPVEQSDLIRLLPPDIA